MEVHHPDFKPDYKIRFRSSEPNAYDELASQFSVDPQFYFAGDASGLPVLSPTFRGACVVKTSAQTLTSGAGTTVTWDQAQWDTDSFWSAGANTRLTIPSGVSWVRISTNIGWENNSSGWRQVNFWRNGSNSTFEGAGEHRQGGNSDWSGIGASSAPIPVQAGDYFEIRAAHNRGADNDIVATENRSWFAVEVLG
jgi:hypothetical protein